MPPFLAVACLDDDDDADAISKADLGVLLPLTLSRRLTLTLRLRLRLGDAMSSREDLYFPSLARRLTLTLRLRWRPLTLLLRLLRVGDESSILLSGSEDDEEIFSFLSLLRAAFRLSFLSLSLLRLSALRVRDRSVPVFLLSRLLRSKRNSDKDDDRCRVSRPRVGFVLEGVVVVVESSKDLGGGEGDFCDLRLRLLDRLRPRLRLGLLALAL